MRALLSGGEYAAERWCDLAAGVRVKLRPLTGLTSLAVEAEVASELQKFRAGVGVLHSLGLPEAHFGALADESAQAGIFLFLKAVVTARALIADWNVTGEGGQPEPVEARTIAGLFNEPTVGPQLLAAFQAVVDEPIRRQRAEGELFAALPNGSSGEAATTAEAAEKPVPPAHADCTPATASSARRSRTHRRPPPGSLPGAPLSPSAPGGPEK